MRPPKRKDAEVPPPPRVYVMREKRTWTLQEGGCPECGHMMLLLGSGKMWCPDEDCHAGGHNPARDAARNRNNPLTA